MHLFNCDGDFGNADFKNPRANREFEMLVERLRKLESNGWVKLSTRYQHDY